MLKGTQLQRQILNCFLIYSSLLVCFYCMSALYRPVAASVYYARMPALDATMHVPLIASQLNITHLSVYSILIDAISLQITSSSGFRLTSASLQTSKLSQLLAILGATLSRFGTMPLYNPLRPSWNRLRRTSLRARLVELLL